ncbi:uncharacterized protein [Nicotiana tomentosiformis]|uniref:uncharacterized protein n=1 Tax=Nicotiana tomentosiformis TaxID=4098 RepID=UPI00388CDFA5
MTRKFLAKYFSSAKTSKFRREIHNFCQKDTETMFEAWERFKEIVRKCQHIGIELWMHYQDFWDRFTPASRRTLSNAVGGPLMKKTLEEIVTILDELSKDANQWPSKSAERRRSTSVHQIDVNTSMQVQLDSMAKEIQKLTLATIQCKPHGACDICGIGHPTHECQASTEEVNAVGNYNAMSQRHPGFSWSSPGGTANKKKGKKGADKKKKEETSRRDESNESEHMLAQPFPQKLYREKLDKQFERFLDMLKQVNVNFLFTEVLSQMPAYAKCLKEIHTKKRKIEETSVVKLTEHYNAILQNKLPQ